MNPFLYSPGLSFIFSTRFLIISQSSMYFVNNSLFLFLGAKIKYLFPLLFSICPSTLSKIEDLHYEYLHIQDFSLRYI